MCARMIKTNLDMIKFALVGCGRIAKRHADLLSQGAIDNAVLCAVSDINSNRLKEFVDKYNVAGYTDYREMMSLESPDVVVVLTESGNHAQHVIELAKFQKHIIVEKPMALLPTDADKMIEACDASSIKLFVIKQNRFNLPILKLRSALEQNRFGKLVSASIRVRWCRDQSYYDQDKWRGTWAKDGGVLTNQAIHHIDMLQWMMGDATEVFAFSATQLVDIETEDTAVVSLKFANGALGSIEATTAARPADQEGSISILGELGLVEIGGFAMNEVKTWQFVNETDDDKKVKEMCSNNPPDVYGFGHKAFYDHVLAAIIDDSSCFIDGRAGKKSIELLHAIYLSIETGTSIRLCDNPKSKRLGIV